jgi:hypothetical protein
MKEISMRETTLRGRIATGMILSGFACWLAAVALWLGYA